MHCHTKVPLNNAMFYTENGGAHYTSLRERRLCCVRTSGFLAGLLAYMECFHCSALSRSLRLSTRSTLSCSSMNWKAFLLRTLTITGLGSGLELSAFSIDSTWSHNAHQETALIFSFAASTALRVLAGVGFLWVFHLQLFFSPL